ncbi:hypothetical protein [Alkalicoccus halolimnae]|uniref:Uncharacterized protein n=1 Tax=Alkalicoccus halolimnae TaxID=1667239 RepID=A0A5C7F850_9BACI|nr:hypothetical protein [Alkalicoccus halolimnae]TXF86233.1 hypothetical protein FTX54_06405 [Alkalicoccus halolimnae]
MLQILVGVLMTGGVISFIVLDKRKLSRKTGHSNSDSKKSAGTELERAEKLNEHQKGQGRAGGPF